MKEVVVLVVLVVLVEWKGSLLWALDEEPPAAAAGSLTPSLLFDFFFFFFLYGEMSLGGLGDHERISEEVAAALSDPEEQRVPVRDERPLLYQQK